jgi:uncharacterized protein YkwD
MYLTKTLAHLFLPRHTNNHRAKILHPSSLTFLSFSLIIFQLFLRFIPTNYTPASAEVLGYASQISTSEVIRLTNEKRVQNGLSPVTFNQLLTDAAKEKAEHMIANDYWAHNAPDGTQPWYFFTKHGYSYRYAGENLARDFSGAAAVVDAWMASPSHRDNMLSTKYKEIGVAVTEGDLSGSDTTIVVQLFGTTLAAAQSTTTAQAASNISPTKVPVKAMTTAVPTASLTPTEEPSPTVIVAPDDIPPSQLVENDLFSQQTATGLTAFFSQFETTRAVSVVVVGLLLFVTIIDAVVVAKRRIPRVSGRVFAHLAFFGMIIAVVLIIRAGKIL